MKSINDNIEVFVCELVPSLDSEFDVKVNNFNVQVEKWATANGIRLLKTNLNYRLGTGEVDDMCFNDPVAHETERLNRFGVLRFLSIINKQCQFLELSESFKIELRKPKKDNPPQQEATSDSRNQTVDYIANEGASGQYRRVRNNVNGNRWGSRNRYNQRSPYEDRNREVRPQDTRTPYDMPHSNPRLNEINYNIPFHKRSRNGCYNCGEFNHQVRSCRFDHQLRCGNCGKLGHKSKLCRENIYVD